MPGLSTTSAASHLPSQEYTPILISYFGMTYTKLQDS